MQVMAEYSVESSATLDALETDCLTRICKDYETASEADCQAMIAAVNGYEAQDKIKQPFLQKLQSRIESIWSAESRIESIWSAEDGEVFDNLYRQIDLADAEARKNAADLIQSRARTDASKKYIDALQKCSPKKIKQARLYKYSKRRTLYTVLIILSVVFSIAGAAVIGVPAAILFLCLRIRLKSAWKLLTLDGTVVPPLLASKNAAQVQPVPAAIPDTPQKSQEKS